MTKIRKTIAFIMTLLIAVSCVPMGAFAEGTEGQEIVTEDTVPETNVETEIEVPPEEETALPAEDGVPAESEDIPEETAVDPVDDPQEEEDPGITEEPDPVMVAEEPVIKITEEDMTAIDPVPEAISDEPADDGIVSEEEIIVDDPALEAEAVIPETEETSETEAEDETELTVRGNLLLAAEPTRGSAYLQMIDMDQYSYSFGSNYPEPFKNESRKRSCQFWFNGVPAYCLQFGVDSSSGMSYSSQDTWDGISESDKRLLSWVLRFGYIGWTRYGASTAQEYMATQVLIWQILSHTVNTSWEQSICNEMMGSGSYAQDVYWQIRAHVFAAETIPSFCSSTDNSSTPIYDLEKQSEGGYSVKLTDTNGVLSRFDFSQDGVSAVRDGNTLTITLDSPVEELTLSANKNFSDWTSGNVYFWKPASSGYQYMASFDTGKTPEQVKAVFKVTAPMGYLDVTKVSANTACTDGNDMYSLEGTTFEVKDSDGNIVGTLVVDENGKVETLELPAGTYTVTETAVGKGYIRNTEVKTVTIVPGETATVTFINKPVADPVSIYLRKWDKEADRAVPQGAGSFAGAQYRVEYYDNTDWSGEPEAVWVFQTDANGILRYKPSYKVSGPDLYTLNGDYVIPLGSVKIYEIKAPEGYLVSLDELYLTITQNGDQTDVQWTTETRGLIKEIPDGYGVPETVIHGGVRFKKTDIETGTPVGGAEISIYSDSDETVLVNGTEYSKGDLIVTLTTDGNGICETESDFLPYGSYYAMETKPSDMYLLNEKWKAEFSITENLKVVNLTSDADQLKEQIIRGDLSMLKLDIDGNYKANVPFMIVRINDDGTEGESHIIVTDENGMIDTSAASRKHTNNTNSMDQYVDGGTFTDVTRLDAFAGVWFGDSEPDDSLGALPYGRYKVYELQTEQLASEQINMLESRIIEITQPDRTVTLAPMVNLNIELASKAASAEGNDFIAAATVGVVDTVHYTNLTSHRRYTMETQFVLKSTSEVLGTVSKDFYPPDGPNGTGTAGGSVTLEAEIDTSGYDGDFVVACDYLYEYVMGTKILIASHADMEDAAQTLKIPSIRTNARDSRTNDNVGTVCGNAEIIDTVSFTNLKKGEVFKLVSKLGDIETGEYIKGKDGEDLIVEQGFVCWTENGSIEMPAFMIDSREYEGKSVVVVEELFWVDEGNDTEVLLTSHISFDDKDQMITYPEIHTTAADENTAGHVGVVSEETVITDTVKLSGLIPDSEYTVSGTLVYKEKFTDKDGVTQKEGDSVPVMDDSVTEVTFTADAADMEIVLSYVIDSAVSEGHTAVVFEDLIHNGVTVASHADLEDKEQSVYFPELRTQAIDKESGSCFVTKGEEVILEDTVSYSNLIPGETYIVKGVLMDKNTGTSTGIISESAVFEPNSAEGTVTVQFAVDTEANASCIFVVFEDLYLIKEDGSEILIVKHEDLDDEAQTLYSPEIGTTATDAVSGTHEAQGTESTAVIDRVEYRNLKAGEKYTVTGTLMDKSTGEPVVIDGEAVTAEAEFTADDKDGTVELTFVFDGTELVGKTVVVFESLMYEDLEIAVHADIDDEDQSVNIINIRTLARDGQNGTRTAEWNHEAVIVDTVSYKGLTPGKQYTLYGVIVLRSTGEYLVQENGIIEAVMEFVPEEPDGTVEMEFTVDTEALQGQDLVVFERLYEGSVSVGDIDVIVPVARHEDVNDRDQTVSVPVRPVPVPQTGDDSNINLWGALCIMSLVLLLQLNGKRKRR